MSNQINQLLTVIFCFILTVYCQKETATDSMSIQVNQSDKLEMDHYILQKIKDSNEPFDWNLESDEMLHKAIKLTDDILVVGYTNGISKDLNTRDEILLDIYNWEGKTSNELGSLDDLLIYKDDDLGFMSLKINHLSTLQKVRELSTVKYVEANGYGIDYDLIKSYADSEPINHIDDVSNNRREVVLDPLQTDPDYPIQVDNYDSQFGHVIRRHNLDEVYRQYQIYGEGIGVAVVDNGIVPWTLDLFEENGYGSREAVGFHKPQWFFPWTDDDGIEPITTDVFGISNMVEGQWLHGSGMIQSVLVIAPNANITCVRASTAILILFPSQIIGITTAMRAMGNREDIRIINMSMGTIFYNHRIHMSINYCYNKGKIVGCAAGTTPEEIKDLLGVIFPANMPKSIAVTGINNRESTNGEFIAGSTAHTGEEVEFCVENSAASSEATARMMGMFALIWSANPDLTREQVINIAIESSHFYQETGERDPDFGWGTVNMLQAIEMALE